MKDFTTRERVTIGVYFQWFLRSFMLYMVVIFKSSGFFLDFFALMRFKSWFLKSHEGSSLNTCFFIFVKYLFLCCRFRFTDMNQ